MVKGASLKRKAEHHTNKFLRVLSIVHVVEFIKRYLYEITMASNPYFVKHALNNRMLYFVTSSIRKFVRVKIKFIFLFLRNNTLF